MVGIFMTKFYLIICISLIGKVYGQVSVIEPLSFGTIVVVKNAPDTSVTLSPNGSITSKNIHIMQVGQPAELLFEGLAPRIQITVNDFASPTQFRRVNGGNEFTLSNLTFLPATVTTNAYGMATVKIGGQLTTSGNGLPYLDGSYSAIVEVTIDY
ncbi:MAG: hypothetical protein ACI92T_003190 [Pseudoalteromonas distincta]|jgi:hypothetical protein